jgi:hypothetical protein
MISWLSFLLPSYVRIDADAPFLPVLTVVFTMAPEKAQREFILCEVESSAWVVPRASLSLGNPRPLLRPLRTYGPVALLLLWWYGPASLSDVKPRILRARRRGRRATIEAAVMPRPGSMMVQIMVSALASMDSIVRGLSRMEGV